MRRCHDDSRLILIRKGSIHKLQRVHQHFENEWQRRNMDSSLGEEAKTVRNLITRPVITIAKRLSVRDCVPILCMFVCYARGKRVEWRAGACMQPWRD